jgi:HNH endonuclease
VTSASNTSTTSAGAAVDRVTKEIHGRIAPWLQTREGIAAASLAAVAFCVLWVAVGAPLISDLLAAAAATVLVSLLARLWEVQTTPPAPAFSSIREDVDGSIELGQDENAGFWRDKRGFLGARRVWFAGTGCPPCRLRPDVYLRLRAWRDQGDLPVFVARSRERQWWWWQDAFYWESGDFEPEDVRAFLVMLERDDEQGLELELGLHRAEPIPVDVKRFVFERDRGRCLACGSEDLIQYDHVIPWSMGGGNEPDNLRLLCAECNRRQRRRQGLEAGV